MKTDRKETIFWYIENEFGNKDIAYLEKLIKELLDETFTEGVKEGKKRLLNDLLIIMEQATLEDFENELKKLVIE